MYHIAYLSGGQEPDLNARAQSGTLVYDDVSLSIQNKDAVAISIPFAEIERLEWLRIQIGSMIKVVCPNQTLFLTVPRLNLGGYFLTINAIRTRELFERLT